MPRFPNYSVKNPHSSKKVSADVHLLVYSFSFKKEMANKFLIFMMSRRARSIFAVLLVGGILSVCACRARNNDDTLARQQQLLVGIGMILKQRHYSPKAVNDAFSEEIFKNYLSQLDEEKILFTQNDIAVLSQYKDKIDDEMNGEVPMQFYPSAIAIFEQRLAAAKPLYTEILSHPFDFTKDEMYQPAADSLDYPADSVADREAWRLRLKYRTLAAYSELLSQKQNAKATDSIKKKSDADLEKEARNSVKGIYDRQFNSRFNPKTFDATAQFSLFMNTITHAMDPHTDYFAPVDKRSFDEDMSNKFYGIGAGLNAKDGLIVIESVMTGGAAWKSKKISEGDAILKVAEGDAQPTDLTGYSLPDAIKLIRGSKGSVVKLTMKKAATGSIIVVAMNREEVKLDYATAKSLIINQGSKKIGYISLPEFYADFQDASNPSCSVDVATELKKLNASKIDGLIIDLRDNPGSSLQDVNKIIGYFVQKGPAVQVRDREGEEEQLGDTSGSNAPLYTGPLTVMVSEFSASASEIFAAAMQDYHRAIIVGSTSTYGKGTVQNQLPLGKANANGEPEFGSLKMTIEKFYRINGGSTQMKGVASDVVIPDQREVIKEREKDDPNALPWDKIEPAQYTVWNTPYNRDSIISHAEARINADPIFKSISQTNDWINKNLNAPISLNLEKYKAQEEVIKKMVDKSEIDSANKNDLSVTTLPEDHNKYYNNPDAMKQKLYQAWLKSIGKDSYIKQTVSIVDDMIHSSNQDFATK